MWVDTSRVVRQCEKVESHALFQVERGVLATIIMVSLPHELCGAASLIRHCISIKSASKNIAVEMKKSRHSDCLDWDSSALFLVQNGIYFLRFVTGRRHRAHILPLVRSFPTVCR